MQASQILTAIPFAPKWWKIEGVRGETFSTQESLKRRIRAIISRAPYHVPLVESDRGFLIEVLRRHHDWLAKQGVGIAAVVVRLNPPPGFGTATRGLWLIRLDGSEVDISWLVPLQRGGARSVKNDVALAARREISDQTRALFERLRGTQCPLCNEPLLNGNVDHIAPLTFDRLLGDWLVQESLNLHDIKIADLGIENAFLDRELADRWSRYHSADAKLRVIHPGENLSIARPAE